MTSIGFATLQIIPSLQGVSEAIEKQLDGKVVNVNVQPKVDQKASERAGQQAKETVEKHTKQVRVEPKVDQKAAEDAGKKTGEAVAKGTTGASTAIGGAIIGILQGSADEAGRLLGQKLADNIPGNLTGVAGRIATVLKNSLPSAGAAAGTALATAIGISLTNAIGKERLDKAGQVIMSGLTRAVAGANKATDIGVAIGNKVASGLTSASGVVGGAAATLTNTISDVTQGAAGLKEFLGGKDSFAAPALDAFNDGLSKATPLLNAVTGATTLAATGAQTISIAVGAAQKAQLLWNAALIANPIGLIVAAIAAVVAGLVLFFTKTELGQKIWQGFTDFITAAWDRIKAAFQVAWDIIKAIFQGYIDGAQMVWDGIKTAFGNVVDFVKGLPGRIASTASGMWDGIANAFKAMIDKLKGWWNSFASALSFTTPDWLPGDPVKFSLPTFGGGGYTGGNKDSVAGVVHGGEYVIKASSTAGIENAMPGLLDYLNNKGSLPGFKGGGKVELGNISAPGITTQEQQSMWDAVRGKFPSAILSSATRTVMTEGHPDYHNAGRAIDISGPGMGAIASWIASNYPDSLELIHSPFGSNIKNGKSVGDGMSFYGSGLMAAHRDHVHWALGKTAAAVTSSADSSTSTEAMIGPAITTAPMTGDVASSSQTTSTGGQGSKVTLASSISGMSSMGFENLGAGVGKTPKGTSDLRGITSAAGAAVSGQVSSALGVLGVNDSPGWLKGAAMLLNSASVSDGPAGGDSVSPVSAATPAMSAAGSALGAVGGAAAQQPVSQVNYNIQTTDIEPAYLASQRLDKERAAARMSRFA